MNTEHSPIRVTVRWFAVLSLLLTAVQILPAQTQYIANNVPAGTAGNLSPQNGALGLDFYVNSPVTVSQLGVFDDLTNGISGSSVLTVQLYVHNVNEDPSQDSGTLLETVTFDAANPGTLTGGSRFKALESPVTLLPGPYTIVAYGFDTNNPAGARGVAPYSGTAPWSLNDGGGLIEFKQSRTGSGGSFPNNGSTGAADGYAAGTFIYTAANVPASLHAADYAALTAGNPAFRYVHRRRTGSIALFGYNSFPVLVEPSGNRLVMEAGGYYNDDVNQGRVVVFSHWEWSHQHKQGLLTDAVQWASRKSDPAQTVVAMGPMAQTNYNFFSSLGYQVRPFSGQMAGTTNTVPPCDVIVVEWSTNFDDTVAAQIGYLTSHGVGLVVAMSPWEMLHGGIQPAFGQVNQLLQPFGLLYRPSTTIPQDLSFTNVQSAAYPEYYSAYPAATLLGEDHVGQIKLDSLQKVIALNTINYVLNARPDLMEELTALSEGGSTNVGGLPPVSAGPFSDVVVLNGSEATTNRMGQWQADGTDLVAVDRRGVVEYTFNLAGADLYKLQVIGSQNLAGSPHNDFDLVLTLDGVNLGHHSLTAGYGTNGVMECFTPYIPAGAHTLRIFWDNAANYTALRLKSVHVQSGAGADSNGNGIKDWVDQLVQTQSGMDLTNGTMASYVSPICLQGRDPYLPLMQINVQGSQNNTPQVRPAPNGRWYADVALPPDQHTPLILDVSYQNGALSQWRQIQWQPINLLTTTNVNWTIRQGDSLWLGAKPAGGLNLPVVITTGTNQYKTTANNPLPIRFNHAGVITVTGTYQDAIPQSGSITVEVINYQFPPNPDAWALNERYWDLTNLPAVTVLDADQRLIFDKLADLPEGQRMGLVADRNEPRQVLALMGTNGPVLDSARVLGFRFWSSEGTYTKVLQTYPDGSQLVETLLILSPVPADLTLDMKVIVGGVIFTDGTTEKILSAGDFDALGRCKVQFIRPASARTSVCHSITLYQNGVVVGTVQ